jgi:hypothetical protein
VSAIAAGVNAHDEDTGQLVTLSSGAFVPRDQRWFSVFKGTYKTFNWLE